MCRRRLTILVLAVMVSASTSAAQDAASFVRSVLTDGKLGFLSSFLKNSVRNESPAAVETGNFWGSRFSFGPDPIKVCVWLFW